MLNSVILFSLRNRTLIVGLSLAVLVYGSYLATRMPIDVLPSLDRPRVVIMTESPGLAAEEVETLVTYPLEAAFLGASGVQAVRSESGPSLSMVHVEFDWGTNIYTARQVAQERLASVAASLPEGVSPVMAPITSIMGQILFIGITRKRGPQGGALASVGKTNYLLELCERPETLDIYLWNPRDEQGKRLADPKRWSPLLASSVSLVSPGAGNGLGPANLPPQSVGQGPSSAHFQFPHRSDPRTPGEHRFIVTLQGHNHEVLVSARQQDMDLRTLADWTILPRLKLPGVAQVTAMGGNRKQYQVLLDPEAMAQYGVTLDEVELVLRKNNLNASGGLAERANMEMPIRVLSRLGPDPQKVLEELRRLPVKQTPQRTILIEQIAARVIEGPQFKRGDASVDGLPGVLITVRKQLNTDTRAVTVNVLNALKELEATLPADIEINSEVFQMKNFIDRSIYNVGEALALGALLVLIILFLFLLNFRTTIISLSAIPLSLALSALVFRVVGWISGVELSINVMTLGGLAVAMGELVDDAIVDVENIFRRLRENNALPQPRPVLNVIYDASVEVRGAIVFGTVMVILVFLPLFALSGMEGRLFTPLAVAYIVAILASLLVSLTVTPVLSYYLLPGAKVTHRQEDSPVLRGLKWLAARFVRFSMARPGWILLGSWLTVIAAGVGLSLLGTDFLPPFDEGSVQVNVTLPAGASLDASINLAGSVDARFRQMLKTSENPHGLLLHFVRKTGRAELDEHVDPVNNNEFILSINPDCGLSREEVLEKILRALKGKAPENNRKGLWSSLARYFRPEQTPAEDKQDEGLKNALVPFATVENEQPLQDLLSQMLSGVSSSIAIKIFGDDLHVLRGVAEKTVAAIGDVPGLTPPVIEEQEMIEELQIRLRPRDLATHGIDRDHAAHNVQVALQGQVVSQVIDGQRRFDLLVRLDDAYRKDFFSLGRLRLNVPNKGTPVMLADIADIGTGYGANYVKRENARRRLVIRCNVLGRDQGSVVEDIEKRIRDKIVLPTGYFLELGGQFQSQREASMVIGILAIVSVAGMFLILYMLYPSARIILQILNALPTAFVGGVLALIVTEQRLNVAAMVGFISLGGIAVRNGILLVAHYFHLMKHENEGFTQEMILRGSLERLAPVLMTALTAGIALVPLVLGGHQPGREILYPVATVILGGLITSTLCEFLIHPGLFWAFSGKDAVRLATQPDEEVAK